VSTLYFLMKIDLHNFSGNIKMILCLMNSVSYIIVIFIYHNYQFICD